MTRPGTVALALALDAACVVGFVATGRSTHARDGGVAGLLGTAWPFLAAAAVGWLVVRGWRAPTRPWPTGIAVWAVTWVGGLALRSATGGGTAPAFVAVAAVVLGLLLVGWRGVATVVSTALTSRRGRRRQPRAAPRR